MMKKLDEYQDEEDEEYDDLTTGECRRCGRKLTDPESVEKGIGPVCEQKEKAQGSKVKDGVNADDHSRKSREMA